MPFESTLDPRAVLDAKRTPNQDELRYVIKDGRIFFIEPYADIEPTIRTGSKDPERWTSWRKSNFEFFKSMLDAASPDSTVLDFGVGQGQFSSLTKKFTQLAAADFFPYPDANVICDLTRPLPFKDAAFDVVIASNVFEHLPNTSEVLRECRRILKPGGRFIGTIPFMLGVHQEPYDFHRYTYLMLEQLLREAGFEDIRVDPLASASDLYLHTQKHFFYRVFNRSESITNPLNRLVWFIYSKFIWLSQRLLNTLAAPLFHQVPTEPDFVLGYSFTAKKS